MKSVSSAARFRRVLFLSFALFCALTSAWLSTIPAPAQARAVIPPGKEYAQVPSLKPAATKTVTNTNNSGVGSLRAALIAAGAGDTIQFSVAPNSIITISSGLTVTQFITIDGSTAANLTVSGGNFHRVFSVTAPATFISFTIMNGIVIGDGGGLNSTSALTLTAMRFLSNSANSLGAGAYVAGALKLNNGLFQNNQSGNDGGGLYALSTLALTGTQFINNIADDRGGGAFVGGAAMLNNGLFQNNQSTSNYGGGLYAHNTSTLTGTQFISNTAASLGGGAALSGAATLNGGLFQNNKSTSNLGGGLYMGNNPLVLTGTQFISNTAFSHGGGLYADGVSTLTGTQLISNTASGNGGGAYLNAAATLNNGLFQNNRSAANNGGGLYVASTLALTGTQFISNTAGQGGGVYHNSNTGRVVNALFARNAVSNTFGTALYLNSPSSVEILHTTIASSTLSSGSAIYIAAGNVNITNTIVASHTVGINRSSGTVYEDYNLFFGNTTDKSGAMSGGTSDITGINPDFVNPAADNYHLIPGSPAINAGTNAGITTDIDGQTRPAGSGFDIGYDELLVILRLFLPLIVR